MGMENYAGGGTGARGREESPRISLNYKSSGKVYTNGDTVSVIRSDGTLENDWTFMHQRMDTGEIVVRKNIGEKTMEKEIKSMIFDKIQKAVE